MHVSVSVCVCVCVHRYVCASWPHGETPCFSSSQTLEHAYVVLQISAGGLSDPFVQVHVFFRSQPVPAVCVCVCVCERERERERELLHVM